MKLYRGSNRDTVFGWSGAPVADRERAAVSIPVLNLEFRADYDPIGQGIIDTGVNIDRRVKQLFMSGGRLPARKPILSCSFLVPTSCAAR